MRPPAAQRAARDAAQRAPAVHGAALALFPVLIRIGQRVFEQIAEIAIEYKTGARSLRGIFEELMTPILYVVPDNRDIFKVEVRTLFEEPLYSRKPPATT